MSAWDEMIARRFPQADKMIMFRDLIWTTAGYLPTPTQKTIIDAARLTKLISGGVRAGKSYTSAMMMADFCALEGEEIWLIGDTYEDARQEFSYLCNPLMEIGLVTKNNLSMPEDGRWKMVIPGGAVVRTKASRDISKIASKAPIAQLYAEAAQQSPEIFEKGSERALERDGFVLFSGTLEASKQLEFTNKFMAWRKPDTDDDTEPQSWAMPTWSNIRAFPLGEADPKFARMKLSMTKEKYDERVAAVPYRPAGQVHKRFTERNIAPLQLDPNLPVELAIDPGYTSYVVLFLQRSGEYVHVLGEIYRHEALTHDIVSETMAHPYWEFVNWGLIDKAARQHQAQESVWEVWRRLTGIPLITVPVTVQDGIDAIETRCMNGEDGSPRLLVNSEMPFDVSGNGKANSLRGEFAQRRFPKYKTGRMDGVKPIKANDHALNALGYYLFFHYRQELDERRKPDQIGRRPVLPKRLQSYVHHQKSSTIGPVMPTYAGNKSRWTTFQKTRSARR